VWEVFTVVDHSLKEQENLREKREMEAEKKKALQIKRANVNSKLDVSIA
jgi:hypothetical protein